ncbi:protein angel homolog 1 isoform X2 [Channa argus]
MKELSPEEEEEDRARPDTDVRQLLAALLEEKENEPAVMISKNQSGVEEKEADVRNGRQQDKMDAEKQKGEEMIVRVDVLHKKGNPADGSIFPTEDNHSEEPLGEHLKRVQTGEHMQEPTGPVQEQMQILTLKSQVIPAEDNIQEITCPIIEQIQIPTLEGLVILAEDNTQDTTYPVQEQIKSSEESLTLTESITQVSECWDEYVLSTADEMQGCTSSSELLFASSLYETQTCPDLHGQHDERAGWHFRVGPGLSEEVYCPLWQFPSASYYPPVEQLLPFEVMWRVWEEMEECTNAEKTLPFINPTMSFTVMSYNILAQYLLEANQELYIHCPLEVLDWSYRYNLIIEEIQKWAPDILCLQEVQENHYQEQLCPFLSQMGYTCVYKRRTGMKTDGCATCYRSSYFSEISLTELEFFKPETELLDRHNVGIVLLLQPWVTQGSKVKAKASPLCVANTHLLFNPRRGDVKLAQLAMMLSEIDCMVKSCQVKGEHCNVILCGDFNSLPHMPLYQLITTGELYYQGLPAWMISGQEDLSHKTHCYRLFAPLWPNSLGITDNCQYTAVNDLFENQNQESGRFQYSHNFMLQLRYCPAACVRPQDLKLIPGVTDNTPNASRENQPCDKRFRHSISHRLDLKSVYRHILPGSGNSEVTTLNSEVGATVDYIFYSPRRILTTDQKAGGDFVSRGLKLTGRLSLPSEDVLWSLKGLPNHIFPSDHLSLVAKFQLDLNGA